MNVLAFKPLVSINVVPPRSESIRRMSFKPFLVIGNPIHYSFSSTTQTYLTCAKTAHGLVNVFLLDALQRR